MTLQELYVKGARIWIPHLENVWEGAVLDENYDPKLNFVNVTTDKGVKRRIEIKNEKELPHLRNPAILIGQNDLTALSYLHEPDVLYNLEVRFKERQLIYTYCGIILVAINPYKELPLYGSDIIQAYRGHSIGELEPHIFAVAEEAYAKLEREKSNISIIVSGESGAGKTVSAKYAMRYFAVIGGSESETQIERKVIASSPIMESIGNAKTTRNDNSSRFGKFTKLLFTNKISMMSLTGATMQTYLLEKSRVVFQAPNERNYHIFYQLCAGRDKYPEFLLAHPDKFKYLNQGQSPVIPKIIDEDEFNETLKAFSTLGFTTDEVNNIIRVIAGILHLGNISINAADQESCSIASNDLSLGILSDILSLNKTDLLKWLTTRQIESINDTVLIPMNKATAEAARDALAKHIYSKLFLYIVKTINRNLDMGKKDENFIGVLDIYGFETFEFNSFEQFCINYANEKLQQQFNQHVFKLEQEQYLKEGIIWNMIDFYDNQPCIDLIESKLGILDLLDDECRVPNGSDDSWIVKLNEKCGKYKHFEKPRFGMTAFLVKHFSDTVQYESFGFLEKNRDTVSKELVNVVQQSDVDFCRHLMLLDEKNDKTKSLQTGTSSLKVVVSASKLQTLPSKQHKQTVGSQFRESLTQLITTLHSTTPHYVRCIKPNDDKEAFSWEASKIVQQLRACGVLETVRISAAGFPSRWSYEDFYERYRLLCKRAEIVDWNVKATCTNIVRNWLQDEDKYRFGHTQIFFRAGQVAYLEQLRMELRRKYIIIVQSTIRRFIYRTKYLRLKRTALGLQKYSRGLLARRKANNLRQNRAAVQIQRFMKGWFVRTKYINAKKSILAIQKYGRGYLARKRFEKTMDNYKATEIQRFCRGFLARRKYNQKIRQIIIVQCCIRRFLARKKIKILKAEARSISHLQTKYKGLENKIIELQQKYDQLNKENANLKIQVSVIPELRNKADCLKAIENELKVVKSALSDKEDQLISVQKSLDRERDEKMTLLDEKTKDEENWLIERNQFIIEKEELKQQLSETLALNKNDENEKLREAEINEINQAYHKAIKNKESLESENVLLKQEIKRLQMIISNSNDIENLRTFGNEEDHGYSSQKNTLEKTKHHDSSVSEGEFFSLPNSNQSSILHNSTTPSIFERKLKNFFRFSTNRNSEDQTTSTPNNSPIHNQDATVLMLRLRKLLEEEKSKGDSLRNEIDRIKRKSNTSISEDSIKLSELEVENEKLRQDYQLLRNSIKRGVEQQELEAQYISLVEELKRRRDECIQLRSILSQQSQSIRTFGNLDSSTRSIDNSELMEAFQAQKLANKQLESELTALTEEHNMKLTEMMREIDALRNEKCMLESIIQDKLEMENGIDPTILRQKESYLRLELERCSAAYVDSQEQLNIAKNQLIELQKCSNILSNRLKEHGLNDSILSSNAIGNSMAGVMKKKAQSYQGILKHQNSDELKIVQRLVHELTPRIAITLLPSLPAYILFMCIRYTDLLNADDQVKSLLTNFILAVKKIFKSPSKPEARILWIVNSITLHNLLKQYGGNEEYMRYNTELQNQQQLKNFDLSEYRVVLQEAIIYMYESLIRQIQESIKPHIVPAILHHDETARGKSRRSQISESPSAENRIEPQSLIDQLDYLHKQCMFFGLYEGYIEQIFQQLFYYICAIALNNLMLRRDLCTWKTGMKLKFNLSCLETWVKKQKMSDSIISPSSPLTEAALLLQSRKTDADVDSICEICPSLTSAQILKLVKSYTPDDCEDTISPTFIEKLSVKLKEIKINDTSLNETFTMDENHINPFRVIFKYNDMKLEDIEIPEVLKIDNLVTKI
ncbi:hypothetical protein PVAND_006716 [Polypedilum vanderplanki]|uniref:Uncharacterized protein n=1 Tax=Polypedilum vanderplanki TaxID=319348 RepID=A0A9J6C4I8_POLVA|nr:hypothetical protein PVAND_006716 [Polypedilum vanderplanki]